MFSKYRPKKFCREFVDESLDKQLPLIMATIKGLKPVSDIWIPCNKYEIFLEICNKYKLLHYPNGIFIQAPNPYLSEIYKKYPDYRHSTTKVIGKPFSKKNIHRNTGSVHIFITKREELLTDAVKYGWYPQIINHKLIEKPPIDLLHFGEVLGYPDCCIEFFNKNHKQDIPIYFNRLLNTKGKNSIYCNNILNHVSYSYVHHTSCTLDCKKTISWAKKIEEAVYEEEPEYVELIRHALKLPIITWGEKNSYVFDGIINDNTIKYKDVVYIGDERDNRYGELFKSGNAVKVFDNRIEVKGNRKITYIRKDVPEFGFILEFE